VIANVASLSESGIYSLSARFKVPLLMGAQAFAMKLRPVAAKLNREDIGVLVRENKNFMFSNIALILFGSFFAIFFAERIFGSSYNGLNAVFAISIITAIPNGIILVSSSFLSSIGQEQFIAKVTIVSVISALAGVAFSATVASSMGAVLFLLIQGTVISIILVRKSTFHYREL
jgi:O-antigen/teichoic acid export membrane protein